MSDKYQQFYGKDVDVVSGPHEGRGGRILEIRDVALDGREPEAYALIEFAEKNCFNEIHTDQLSVPIRRVALRR
jgi:hypothetical protein